jgi:glycosyltransferase involved in cell wall biosynthesis
MIAINRAMGTWVNKVDRFITLSDFSLRKLRSSGIPGEKIHVKPNFVLPDPGLRTRISDHAVYVGRLAAEKGVPTLLRAWKGLAGKLALKIIGGGPQRSHLEAFCDSKQIKGVYFLGQRPRSEALDQIRSARFLVFPSESYENFPMCIVEAYACGVPVIAAKIGSTAEIVHDGVTGMTFKPGNAQELLDRVQWAMEHPDLLEEMGRRARTEFEVKYTASRNYGMLMNIYALALGRRQIDEPLAVPEVA